MTDRVHRGTVFGMQAAEYAAHRPGYATAALEWALAPVAGASPPRVLDLAAGTGKLTEGLVDLGAEVIAVEPDPAMLAQLTERFPDVDARIGAAERIPLSDDAVHAVLVGQAMHWFDLDLAIPEIIRVLRPGGVFAALWNVVDNRVPWVAGYARAAGALPLLTTTSSRGRLVLPRLGELDLGEFAHRQRRTAEALVATVATHSDTLLLEPAERQAKLDTVLAYLRDRPETAHGEFELPLITVVRRRQVRSR